MKFNTILKTLGLIAFASPLVFAGDCDDLEKYMKGKHGNISECEESNGKVVSVEISDFDLSEKDIDKVLSYDSIKSLQYYIDADPYEFKDKPEEETENNVSRQINKLTSLNKLKNLEDLAISYSSSISVGIGHDKNFLGQIGENTFKDITSLKSLDVYGVKVTQKNIEEISSLKNLESLSFHTSSFEKCNNFKSLSKLENVKSLKISETTHVNSELVNAIKSIKELDLYEVDGDLKIDALPNVESITWDKDDLSSLGKLEKLVKLKLNVSPHYGHDFTSLENLSQIKILSISGSKVYPGSAGPECNALTLKFAEDAQLQELKIETAYPSESSLNEIKKLKHLQKFTAECDAYKDDEAEKLLEESNKIGSNIPSNVVDATTTTITPSATSTVVDATTATITKTVTITPSATSTTIVPQRRRKCIVKNKSN